MDHLLPLVFLEQQAVTVENGQIMDLDEWKERLTALGYERTAQVDGMGQFSIRGGIVDIFPLTEEVPVRIELWDDEVDSIRSFDLESQRSVEQLEKITHLSCQRRRFSDKKQYRSRDSKRHGRGRKDYEAALRARASDWKKHPVSGDIIRELTEEIRQGWKRRWTGCLYPVFLPGDGVISGLFSRQEIL